MRPGGGKGNRLQCAAAIGKFKEHAQGDRQALDLLNRLQQNHQHEIQETQGQLSQYLSSGQKAKAA